LPDTSEDAGKRGARSKNGTPKGAQNVESQAAFLRGDNAEKTDDR